jgi:hypothetical protein
MPWEWFMEVRRNSVESGIVRTNTGRVQTIQAAARQRWCCGLARPIACLFRDLAEWQQQLRGPFEARGGHRRTFRKRQFETWPRLIERPLFASLQSEAVGLQPAPFRSFAFEENAIRLLLVRKIRTAFQLKPDLPLQSDCQQIHEDNASICSLACSITRHGSPNPAGGYQTAPVGSPRVLGEPGERLL